MLDIEDNPTISSSIETKKPSPLNSDDMLIDGDSVNLMKYKRLQTRNYSLFRWCLAHVLCCCFQRRALDPIEEVRGHGKTDTTAEDFVGSTKSIKLPRTNSRRQAAARMALEIFKMSRSSLVNKKV